MASTYGAFSRVRRPAQAGAGAIFVIAALIYTALLATEAWAIMILIGILHSEAGFPPHTLGFWICVPIAVLLKFIITPVEMRRS